MHIFTSLENINISDKTAVALGNFDGIHIGHKVILDDAIASSKSRGLKSLCYTFSNHPFNYIMGRDDCDPDALKLICSEKDKISILESMGFDYLVNVPFDEITMKMRANTFFNDVIIGSLNAQLIAVGFNYSYGVRAEGKAVDLVREGRNNGIEVHVHDAVKLHDTVVSSTLIRETIAVGNMDLAGEYLGRPYSFSGIVEHGKAVGKNLGFPTINIVPDCNRAMPPYGVYSGVSIIDGSRYRSIINIGLQPTFAGSTIKIESHLFDYAADAYGKTAIIELDKFIRPEMKFGNADDLRHQIEKDCEAVIKRK